MFALDNQGTRNAAIYPRAVLSAVDPWPLACQAGGNGAALNIPPALMTAEHGMRPCRCQVGKGGRDFVHKLNFHEIRKSNACGCAANSFVKGQRLEMGLSAAGAALRPTLPCS